MSPIINFLTLTPNNVSEDLWVEVDEIETRIHAKAYPLAGVFLGPLGTVQISGIEISGRPVFRVIYENHRTLHENNKLLLTSNENHEGNQTLGDWWKEAVIFFYCALWRSASGPLFDKQWIISFDVQSYKTNKVQIFAGDVYKGEEVINNRRLVSILLDPIPEFNIFLRVVYPRNDLYFYSVRCDLIY